MGGVIGWVWLGAGGRRNGRTRADVGRAEVWAGGVERGISRRAARGRRNRSRNGALLGRLGVRRQRGLSALELMVALGVAAVLAGLAAPGFAAFRRAAGVSSAANELVWALHLARSSAMLRGQPVTVCLSRDERSCLQSPEAPAEGWLVFQAAGQALAVPGAPSGPIL